MFKKGLKIGCFSILGFFGLLFILAILGVLPKAPVVDEAETIEKEDSLLESPKPPEKANTPGSAKVPPPQQTASDFSQTFLKWEKEKEAEWNLPENANLKNLIKTLPVTETLKPRNRNLGRTPGERYCCIRTENACSSPNARSRKVSGRRYNFCRLRVWIEKRYAKL